MVSTKCTALLSGLLMMCPRPITSLAAARRRRAATACASDEEQERDERHGDDQGGRRGAGQAGEPPGDTGRRRGHVEVDEHDAEQVRDGERGEDEGDGRVEYGASAWRDGVEGVEDRGQDVGAAQRDGKGEPRGAGDGISHLLLGLEQELDASMDGAALL